MHPSAVAYWSTSFGWGKGGNVSSAGWQVTLCDPIWHVSSRSGVATLPTAIHLLLTARRYASAVCAIAVCLCLSVCLSVYHKSEFYIETAKRIELFFGMGLSSTSPNCVVREFGYLQNKCTSLWNFVPNSVLRRFRRGKSSRSCCQQNLWTVELVDHTCDGRRIVAGPTMLYIHCAHKLLHVRRP